MLEGCEGVGVSVKAIPGIIPSFWLQREEEEEEEEEEDDDDDEDEDGEEDDEEGRGDGHT